MKTQAEAKGAAKQVALPTFTPAASGLLQRKCACGGTPGVDGECAACRKKRLQRQSTALAAQAVAPPIVDEVLHSAGQPLDTATRSFMESRFGHNFNNVRIHTDDKAAASARVVNALAYTVGQNIVFAAGHYAPQSSQGRKLLAHELAHVTQQQAGLKRMSISVPSAVEMGPEDDESEENARKIAEQVMKDEELPDETQGGISLQRIPAIVGLDDAGPKADLTGGGKEAELFNCIKQSGPDPTECNPTAALTWANFTGTPVASSPFGAVTGSKVIDVPMPSQSCIRRVLGKVTGPERIFQGKFYSDKSWVKSKPANPTDLAQNGCAALITQCETALDDAAKKNQKGVWFALRTTPDATCPASPVPQGNRATKKAECATVVGADCTGRAIAESARLLKHEQGHFNISCAMAKKANLAVAAGNDFATINTAVTTKLATAQSSYDGETDHGCKAAEQATWESETVKGLPKILLP